MEEGVPRGRDGTEVGVLVAVPGGEEPGRVVGADGLGVAPFAVEGESPAAVVVGLVRTSEPAPVVFVGDRVVGGVEPLDLSGREDVGHVPLPPVCLRGEVTGIAEPGAAFAIGLGGGPGDKIGVVDLNPSPPAPGPEVVDDVDTEIPVEHTPGAGPTGGVEPEPVDDVVPLMDGGGSVALEGVSAGVPGLLVGNGLAVGAESVANLGVPVGDPRAHAVNNLAAHHVPVIDVGDVGLLVGSVVGDPRPGNPGVDSNGGGRAVICGEEENDGDDAGDGEEAEKRSDGGVHFSVDFFFFFLAKRKEKSKKINKKNIYNKKNYSDFI